LLGLIVNLPIPIVKSAHNTCVTRCSVTVSIASFNSDAFFASLLLTFRCVTFEPACSYVFHFYAVPTKRRRKHLFPGRPSVRPLSVREHLSRVTRYLRT